MILAALILWAVILTPVAYISRFVPTRLFFRSHGAARVFLVGVVAELISVRALALGFTDFVNPAQLAFATFSMPGWLVATEVLGMQTRIVGGSGSGFIPPGVIEFPPPMLFVIFVLNVSLVILMALILDLWLTRRKPVLNESADCG